MAITNQLSMSAYQGYSRAEARISKNMSRLSANDALIDRSERPADFGISQNLRFQIQNTIEAKRNIENGLNMTSSADQWLQSVHDILDRMSELASSAIDGSKSANDISSLNAEYLELKSEISRIAQEAKYNGQQVAGRDQVLAYDKDMETFVFSQMDGHASYTLGRTVLSGISSPNNQDYLFSPSNPYTLSADGRSIIYADSSNQLVKLDIGTGNLLRDSSDVGEKNFLTDEQGQFWYATETLAGSHIYSLARQDLSSWTPDSSFSPTAITDMASLQFSVFQDRVTYLSTSGSIVSRDLQRLSDFKTELSPSDISFNTTDGQFALSSDGGLVADMPSANTLRIIDLKTQQEALFSLDASLSVSSLSFNEDGTALFYVNTADGALRTLDITRGPVPDLTNERLLKSPSGSLGYSGLSVKGGSHNANFHIHNGSGSFQEAILTGGDARLFRLGISKTTLHTEADAQEALSSLQEAVERVILQRSVLGAEEARLSKSHDSLMAYGQELESSDSIIRDVDIAKETSELVMAQIWQETSLGMMSQANLRAQAVLRLLYNS